MQALKKLNVQIIILLVAVLLLLCIPIIGMQTESGFDWSVSDFVIAFILLFGSGLAFILISRKLNSWTYKIAVALFVGTSLFLIWSNLAVGLIGSENNDANMMYIAVLAIGFLGSIISRFKPIVMSFTLFAMAGVQGGIGLIAAVLGLGSPENTAFQIIIINSFFVILFLGSALLFRHAAFELKFQRESYDNSIKA